MNVIVSTSGYIQPILWYFDQSNKITAHIFFKMRNKIFLSIFLCMVGFTIQITDICKRYFKYATKTNVQIRIVRSLEIPSVSICSYLTEAVTGTRIEESEEDVLMNVSTNVSINRKIVSHNLSEMTVSDIFKNTASNESILKEDKSCAIRQPNSLIHPHYSRNECLKFIRIRKFLNRYLICYKMEPRDRENYLDYTDVSFTPASPGLISRYFLSPEIYINYTKYTIYIHSKKSSDLYDSAFSVVNSINFHTEPYINVVFTPTTLIRLPPPYNTMCKKIPNYHTIHGYQLDQLNKLVMKEMKHVHTFDHVYRHYDYPIITPEKLKNISFHNQFMKLKSTMTKDVINNCELTYNIPESIEESGENIRISINWPQNSGIKVDFIPDQDTIDLIIYILSSIGIWFGLSMFSILSLIEGIVINRFHIKNNISGSTNRNIHESKENTTYFIIHDSDTILRSNVRSLRGEVIKLREQISRLQT